MEYKQYIKYGINNIKDGEVNIDFISDGVHTLSEYRRFYFLQLILLAKKKINELIKENLFNDEPIENLVEIEERWEPHYRILFQFGKAVYEVPTELHGDFIELKNYQQDQFEQLGKYSKQI